MIKDLHPTLKPLVGEEYCYLTTKGRRTAKPHRIEIWFGLAGGTLYLLSGGGPNSDWVKNLKANPEVSVRIAKEIFQGVARIAAAGEEEKMARDLLAGKYYKWQEGQPLNDWASTALPIAIDLQLE